MIESFASNVAKSNDSIVTLTKTFVESNENKNNTGTYNINKFDKKNKTSIHVEDILDIKKKKNKSQKKTRKQINFENEDLFINQPESIVFGEDNLTTSIIKTPKLNKNKKKIRIKQNENNLIEDLENQSQLSLINSKKILIDSPLTIQELSYKLSIPEAEIITYLFLKGISVTINQVIDIPIANDVALKYDFTVISNKETSDNINLSKLKKIEEYSSDSYSKRPPIITILGHVDHGKTTLLDAILNTNLVKHEIGGITQSIASHEIEWLYDTNLCKLVFLDTPGHEAFASMRIRGTQITDLVLLVVAADDGLKPQTIESIKYILNQKLPYIVVINKIDKPTINTLKVKEELSQYNIIDEKWGGEAIIIEVSALKRQNIDLLLSNICLLSEIQALKANPNQLAKGMIIESYLDQQKGPVAIVVVQDGTLKVGDFVISGSFMGKVKMILDSLNNTVNQALPSSIIQVLGFSSVPEAGISFEVINDKKRLKQYRSNNLNIVQPLEKSLNLLNNRVTLESIKDNYNLKKLNLILKTNNQGSAEAILSSFYQISQEKVQINIISLSAGTISNTDIELATASNSLIIGFNTSISNKARSLAKQLSIQLNSFNIIYDLVDYVTKCMLDLVEVEYDKIMLGKAIVQTVFYINKGAVAGCLVSEGKLKKYTHLNVYREKDLLYTGTLDSLKRMKDDVDEVENGNECGVMSNDYSLWKKDDIIEGYELKAKEKML
uniref:Translation initiation factor IF-2, chloroplastic n=1 Tax=Antithamnionella ternifolia TaxID=207919 RepID=A0A4D6WQU7_9FLOR|nr:Translation initiation factor 2 [Antithamnionella ternifolia]